MHTARGVFEHNSNELALAIKSSRRVLNLVALWQLQISSDHELPSRGIACAYAHAAYTIVFVC
jgi:hypothetical protein